MKTRLISILMIIMLSASFAMAQSNMSVGILGGVNFQNLNGKDSDGDKLENDMILGYHAGVNIQIPIAPEFYFQPGLMFTTAGAKKTYTVLGTDYTSTTKLNYLQLPLNFVYKGALGNGFVLVGFGPYAGYGISGKETLEGGSVTVENDIEFKSTVNEGDDGSYYKRFDAGANIFAGYEMASGLFFQLDTQFGMLKINPEYDAFPDDESTLKNTGFGLSLGYRF